MFGAYIFWFTWLMVNAKVIKQLWKELHESWSAKYLHCEKTEMKTVSIIWREKFGRDGPNSIQHLQEKKRDKREK